MNVVEQIMTKYTADAYVRNATFTLDDLIPTICSLGTVWEMRHPYIGLFLRPLETSHHMSVGLSKRFNLTSAPRYCFMQEKSESRLLHLTQG